MVNRDLNLHTHIKNYIIILSVLTDRLIDRRATKTTVGTDSFEISSIHILKGLETA